MHKLPGFFFFFVLLLIGSCTGSKKLKDANASFEKNSVIALEKIKSQRVDFSSFNANANLDIKTAVFNGSANAKFRIVQDSAIWISISKLGFEVGRLFVNKDSLFFMERIQKTYGKFSFSEVSSEIGFELNYPFLEDFILGNPYLAEKKNAIKFLARDTILVFPELNEYFVQHSISSKDFKLRKTHIVDSATKTETNLTYGDYKELFEDQIFSYFRSIILDEKDGQETEVVIKFSKPELNIEKSLKFDIPDSYTLRKF